MRVSGGGARASPCAPMLRWPKRHRRCRLGARGRPAGRIIGAPAARRLSRRPGREYRLGMSVGVKVKVKLKPSGAGVWWRVFVS